MALVFNKYNVFTLKVTKKKLCVHFFELNELKNQLQKDKNLVIEQLSLK